MSAARTDYLSAAAAAIGDSRGREDVSRRLCSRGLRVLLYDLRPRSGHKLESNL